MSGFAFESNNTSDNQVKDADSLTLDNTNELTLF